MLTELLFRGSGKLVPKMHLISHTHTHRSGECARCAHCLLDLWPGEPGRAASGTITICRLELWAGVRARYKRGIKLRVRTRKKINQEQGRNRDGRNWVPERYM